MKLLLTTAIAEAITLLLLLFVAVPLKYLGGFAVATSIVGPVHGLAFTVFAWSVFREWGRDVVTGSEALKLFAGAFLPFGGFFNERWLRSRAEDGEGP